MFLLTVSASAEPSKPAVKKAAAVFAKLRIAAGTRELKNSRLMIRLKHVFKAVGDYPKATHLEIFTRSRRAMSAPLLTIGLTKMVTV